MLTYRTQRLHRPGISRDRNVMLETLLVDPPHNLGL